MKKLDTSRRKFLGRAGSLAVVLPAAAAFPIVEAVVSNKTVQASEEVGLPNRVLPIRQRGTTVMTLSATAGTGVNYVIPNDGVTDCSSTFNTAIQALGSGGGTIHVKYATPASGLQACTYLIDPTANVVQVASDPTDPERYGIQLTSDMLLLLDPGVILVSKSTNVDRSYVLYANGASNVEVAGGQIIGERYTHTNSGYGSGTDEWNHGIQLRGCSAVTIRDTSFSNFEGDGIDIGPTRDGNLTACNDVVVSNIVCNANRRQGLSIGNSTGVSVYDSMFSNTYGTAPQNGIDIEPDTGAATNVTIDNCVCRGNEGVGIGMTADAGSTITNVNITNCDLCYNGSSGFYSAVSGASGSLPAGATTTGTLYSNAIYQNRWIGLVLDNTTQGYTVGGSSSGDSLNNSFANNQISANAATYPNTVETPQQGTSGVGAQVTLNTTYAQQNNTVNWNNYFTAS